MEEEGSGPEDGRRPPPSYDFFWRSKAEHRRGRKAEQASPAMDPSPADGDLAMYKQALHEQVSESERLDRGVGLLQAHASRIDAELVAERGRSRALLYACVALVVALAVVVVTAPRWICPDRRDDD